MRPRRSSRLLFLLCLLVSAGLHALLFRQARQWTFGDDPPMPRRTSRAADYVVAPPGTLPDPPPANPSPFGEAGGVGDALNSSPGDEPQKAPDAKLDQALWSKAPTGPRDGDAPSPQPTPQPQPVLTPPPAALPTPPVSKLPAFRRPPPPQPQPKAKIAEESRPTLPAAPSTPQRPEQSAGGTPKPHSDQDSDLFAKEIDADFKRGRVVARPGRQVKFTRPQVNLAMLVQSAEIAIPARLRLSVVVPPDGRPKDVRVIDSTGSTSIDRAFLLAAYESWFEPAKDRSGQAIEDVVEFKISIE